MFNYIPNIKCINYNETWLEILITDYQLDLEVDEINISVNGPNFSVSNLIPTYINEEENYVLYRYFGIPSLGTYTFNVNINDTEIIKTNEQLFNRNLPNVENLIYENVVFTWDALPEQDFDIYYGIQVRNINANYILNERRLTQNEYVFELPQGTWQYQIIVIDALKWEDVNNRTNGFWQTITI